MDSDMYLMQTLLIWLVLVESVIKEWSFSQLTKMSDKRHIMLKPTMWSPLALSYPCSILVENTHSCSIPI